MSEFCDINGNTNDVSRNRNKKNDNVGETERNTNAAANERVKGKKKKTQNAHNSSDTEKLLNGTRRQNGVYINKSILRHGEEKHRGGNKKKNENPKTVTESEEENEDEMYSIPSDMDIEFNKLRRATHTNISEDTDDDSFYDIPGNSDDLTNEGIKELLYDNRVSKEKNSKEKHNKNHSGKEEEEYKNKKEGNDKHQEQNREKDKDKSKKDKKEKNKKWTMNQLMDPDFRVSNNFDLQEQIKSTIELCVPNIKSSKETEERMLINMEKISNINLTKGENSGESETVERCMRGLYENVDHIVDVTNKMRLEKERKQSVVVDSELSTKTEQTGNACGKEKTDEKDVSKQNAELIKSSTQEQEGSGLKTVTNILEGETKKEKELRNVEYYLTPSMVELDECINKLCSGSCDFKERNILTQKITKGVPELNNLYSNKNLCYIKDNPTVNEIAQVIPEWKNRFEHMNRRALQDTDDMIHILKRIKNMKHDLHMLNKDLIEDREEFENIKFETVEHEAAVTAIEKKNKKYIKGALQLENMGQKLQRAFNIPTNPLTNFTVSEHINRLLNYEEELLMGNDFTGKDSKPQHFEILRFMNRDKKFEMFEKEDGEACYVIDMLVSDLKKVYEEKKKKEFENIDKKMKLYEMTDINKFKGFMDVTLNNHNICINEFKESIREATIALFDLYEHFASKNLKVKKIDECYIKRYVSKEMLPLHNTEANVKKEKDEEKYFMSLNFTRKKPIDHPFFIYHCLSSAFLFYFVNFVLNPECLENQKDFMQHCSIPGFNSVVFCQQLLKLRKEEKKFTKADLSYDFTSAYAKVLCADLYSVVLKNINDSNSMEEQTGENKYLKALKNASEDFFQNTFKKRTSRGIYKPINSNATNASNILFSGNDKTNISNKNDLNIIFRGANGSSNATLDNANAGLGFQLLHYIPDELTSIRSRHTAICYDNSMPNGIVRASVQNCDINKFNILKVAPHPLLSNTSNELFHRKMKEQAPLFAELSRDSGTNVAANKFLLDSRSSLSNMGKDNFLTSKERSIFGMQNRNVLGNNSTFNMFNQNMSSTNSAITNNNTSLLGGSGIFSNNNSNNNNNINSNNNATSIFTQRNTAALGNNTTSNLFGSAKSNTLFSNTGNSSIFGANSNSPNMFSNQAGGPFSITTNDINKTSTFGANTTPFTNGTTNSFLNSVPGASSSNNIFSNATGNSSFNSAATSNIFGGQGQNKTNSFLNQGSGLTSNSLMNTTGFGIGANTNTMNQSGINTASNIFGNTSSAINTNTSNTNNIFYQNKTSIFSNNTAANSTGNLFAGTSNKFLGNNMNRNNLTGNTTGFGLLGKSGNTDSNTANLYGNTSSANIFAEKATNQTSSLFAPNFSSGTSSFFGNADRNNLNNTMGSNNTNSAMNAFGLSNSTNPMGVNNNSNTLGSGNIFGTSGNNNSSSSLFSNSNTVNNTNSLFGRNEALGISNNSIFGKTSMTTTGSSGLFGSATNSLNNTGMMNNKNASSSGLFGNMLQQNNSPITSFASNNALSTNTNINSQSPKSSPFTSTYEQSKFTNNTNMFSMGNINTGSNINNGNNSIFGMNNVSSGLSVPTGMNPNMGGSSSLFGNKSSAGNISSSALFGGAGNVMSNNSFNNSSAFNTTQTSSFLGKTNPTDAQNNTFSSKLNTNVYSNNSFNTLNAFGGNSNANTSANTFGKNSFFGTTSAGPTDGNKNINTTGSIFSNTPTGSTSNLFGSNSRMGINSFSNSLSNTNMQSGASPTNNSSLFSNAGRMFGSTNMLGSNANTNMNANNVNNNSGSLFASNTVAQNSGANRNNTFGNAMDNRTTSNLFSKNNLANTNFVSNTNMGSTNTGLFQNQQNTFATGNRQGTSIFGMSNNSLTNNSLTNNSLTNNNVTNSVFQNNSFLTGRENMTNASATPGTQNFNLQNNQNIFQQNMTSKSTTRNLTGGFFS